MPVTFARVLAGSVMKTLCDDSDTSDAEVCRIAGAREGGTRKSERVSERERMMANGNGKRGKRRR